MILNERTYRKMKNALLALPGAPSSARMGEFMAAALELGNYKSLQDYLDRVENQFGYPEHMEINLEAALQKLSDFDCHGWPASDIVATFLALNYDGMLWDMANDYEEIQGAAVIRFDHVSERWRKALDDAWDNMNKFMALENIQVDINKIPRWDTDLGFRGIDRYIRTTTSYGSLEPAEMTEDQSMGDLDMFNHCGYSVGMILENILLMVREALPDYHAKLPEGSQGWITRNLVLDVNGLRVKCVAENCDFGFDIWFACFEGGTIPRITSHNARSLH